MTKSDVLDLDGEEESPEVTATPVVSADLVNHADIEAGLLPILLPQKVLRSSGRLPQ